MKDIVANISSPRIKSIYFKTMVGEKFKTNPRSCLTKFEAGLNHLLEITPISLDEHLEARRFITYCNLVELQLDELAFSVDLNNDGIIGFAPIKIY